MKLTITIDFDPKEVNAGDLAADVVGALEDFNDRERPNSLTWNVDCDDVALPDPLCCPDCQGDEREHEDGCARSFRQLDAKRKQLIEEVHGAGVFVGFRLALIEPAAAIPELEQMLCALRS